MKKRTSCGNRIVGELRWCDFNKVRFSKQQRQGTIGFESGRVLFSCGFRNRVPIASENAFKPNLRQGALGAARPKNLSCADVCFYAARFNRRELPPRVRVVRRFIRPGLVPNEIYATDGKPQLFAAAM